ncbi:MAG TPA: CDP-diacylglycerol--glycerol-3-phosphate 3-phosphatidyltransferase, partial [Corynebacterium falsenii]|nr:CDP-diacylglycerol--glycerol-3-phosphate 3-phosphatidyltransferase [Corynebacterium falsenii]
MQQPQTTTSTTGRISPFGRFVRRSSLPNILTTVRIVLIPVFLWLILAS